MILEYEGAKYIIETLKTNHTLTRLYLSHNNIGNEGMKYIAYEIKKNKKYQMIVKKHIKKLLHLIGILSNGHIKSHMYKRVLRQVILANVINAIDLSIKNQKYLLSYI